MAFRTKWKMCLKVKHVKYKRHEHLLINRKEVRKKI